MPGCVAVGCSNSSKKGFIMKKFPKNPRRRREWAVQIKRFQWFPTDTSVLCEEHFEPEMWEATREDGTTRLKSNAVPTNFPCAETKKRKTPYKRKRDTLSDVSEILINDAIPPTSPNAIKVELLDETIPVVFDILETEHSYANLTSVPTSQTSLELLIGTVT